LGREKDPLARSRARWELEFDADEVARLELRMWQAYYRSQSGRLFLLLVTALRRQARVPWARALLSALWLTKGAIRFSRMKKNYDRVLPDIKRGYGAVLRDYDCDLEAIARAELRWWVIRRDLGLSSGEAAGEAITELYSAACGLPFDAVAEAGRLRGVAAQVRDRGATDDPDGPRGAGSSYWPQVAALLRDSYRSLGAAMAGDRPTT
jgi:hypothetical protein